MMNKTLRFDLAVALLALAALLAWDASGLDLLCVRLVGNASGFAWRDVWFTRDLFHEGGRLLAGVLLVLLLVNIWKPLLAGPAKSERVYAFAIAVVCMSLIPVFKRMSHTSCPYDLQEFGGVAQYVSHWSFGLLDGGPGHCFPSGHASAGFGFFSVYFALRRSQPVWARRALAAVLVLGACYGWAQMARGAHYPSHTMWTAWICWLVCAASVRLVQRGERA
jgi:membrane-associated PAP2 superfamily phosphatase